MSNRPLWRECDFALLWAGQTVSEFGSSVTQLALPLVAILTLHASAFEVGALSATTTAAFLLVGLPAGAIVDRLPRRPVLIVADIGRTLLFGSIPVAAAAGILTIFQLYAVALLSGFLTVFFDVGYQSYLPALVTRERLVEGNARLAATEAAARVGGQGIGGALVGAVGAATSMTLDALSYVVSVLSLLAIRGREAPIPPVVNRPTLRRDIGEGLRFVLRHPVLSRIAGRTAMANLGSGIVFAVGTLYMVRALHLRPSVIGAVFAVGGVGGFVGASLSGRISARIGLGPAILAGTATGALGMMTWPLAAFGPAIAVLVVGQVCSGVGVPLYNVAQVSLRQAITPDELLGRMNATMRFLVWGTLPVGGLVGGALGGAIGLRPTLAVGAATSVSSGLWLLTPVIARIRRPEDAPVLESAVVG